MKAKRVTQYRIKGPNAGDYVEEFSEATMRSRLVRFEGYLRYGHTHVLQRRTVTMTPWETIASTEDSASAPESGVGQDEH